MDSYKVNKIVDRIENTRYYINTNIKFARKYDNSELTNLINSLDKRKLTNIPNDVSDTCKELLKDTNCIFKDKKYIHEYDTCINTAGTTKGRAAELLMEKILKENLTDDIQTYISKQQEIMDLYSKKYNIMFEIKNYAKSSHINNDIFGKYAFDAERTPDKLHIFINIQEDKGDFKNSFYNFEYNKIYLNYKDFTYGFIKFIKLICENNKIITDIVNDWKQNNEYNEKYKLSNTRTENSNQLKTAISDLSEQFTNISKMSEQSVKNIESLINNKLYNILLSSLSKVCNYIDCKPIGSKTYFLQNGTDFENLESFILDKLFDNFILFDVQFTKRQLEKLYGYVIDKGTMANITKKYLDVRNVHIQGREIRKISPLEEEKDPDKYVSVYKFKTKFENEELNKRREYILSNDWVQNSKPKQIQEQITPTETTEITDNDEEEETEQEQQTEEEQEAEQETTEEEEEKQEKKTNL